MAQRRRTTPEVIRDIFLTSWLHPTPTNSKFAEGDYLKRVSGEEQLNQVIEAFDLGVSIELAVLCAHREELLRPGKT